MVYLILGSSLLAEAFLGKEEAFGTRLQHWARALLSSALAADMDARRVTAGSRQHSTRAASRSVRRGGGGGQSRTCQDSGSAPEAPDYSVIRRATRRLRARFASRAQTRSHRQSGRRRRESGLDARPRKCRRQADHHDVDRPAPRLQLAPDLPRISVDRELIEDHLCFTRDNGTLRAWVRVGGNDGLDFSSKRTEPVSRRPGGHSCVTHSRNQADTGGHRRT